MEIALKPFSTNSSFVICPSPSTSTAFLAKSKHMHFFFPTGAFSSSHLISWKHSTKLSGSSGSPESWKRPITKSLSFNPVLLIFHWREGLMVIKKTPPFLYDCSSKSYIFCQLSLIYSFFLLDANWDYLSSSTSMEPPPSASKAVKIQLSWLIRNGNDALTSSQSSEMR